LFLMNKGDMKAGGAGCRPSFKMINFFLMTRGRTGSTAVVNMLDKSSTLCVTKELFLNYDFKSNPEFLGEYKLLPPYDVWKSDKWWKSALLHMRQKRVLPNRYLAVAEMLARENNSECFGFKVLSHHFEQRQFLCDLLKRRGYRVVYLTRNVARQVISGMVAKQRGIYNSTRNIVDSNRYVIDWEEFKQLVSLETACVERDCALLRERGFNFCIVSYEEFCNDRKQFFQKIFDFLEQPYEILDSSDYTIMIKDVAQTVENFEEVAKCAKAMGLSLD